MSTYRVTPNDSRTAIQARIDHMSRDDRLLFTPGDYAPMALDFKVADILVEAEAGAFLHGAGTRFNVKAPRNVFHNLVFKDGPTIDVKRAGAMTHIIGCSWYDYTGYAKRIKLGGGRSTHYESLRCVVEDCHFENISGTNNSGRPGGELISVKSSDNLITNCVVKNCVGSVSLRAGWNNTVAHCGFHNITHARSGITVYDFYNKVAGNDMGGYAWIAIGDGDANHDLSKPISPTNKHNPASYISVTHNRDGRIRWLHNYKTHRPQHEVVAANINCEYIK